MHNAMQLTLDEIKIWVYDGLRGSINKIIANKKGDSITERLT
jgi:hypothetical protein